MKEVKWFLTSFNDNEAMHIYFYPGRGEKGQPLARMSFIKPPEDYRYIRQNDGAIDYKVTERGTDEIVCRVHENDGRDYKDIKI